MTGIKRVLPLLVGAGGLLLTGPAIGIGVSKPSECKQAKASDSCSAGNGRTSSGGGDKAPHEGWPPITGVFWKVAGSGNRTFVGGDLNDQLLGRHGSDKITGGKGRDVIWGDWDPKKNPASQKDRLNGGDGDDWIYSSHGANSIRAGAGNDYVWATFGRGFIDCGPGEKDTVRLKIKYRYKVKNCERRTRPGKSGYTVIPKSERRAP